MPVLTKHRGGYPQKEIFYENSPDRVLQQNHPYRPSRNTRPAISDSEVLVWVKVAAITPVGLLILAESVKPVQRDTMPLNLGNECAGIVEQAGNKVHGFQNGDQVYARLPIRKISAFAEYVAVNQQAIAKMPEEYDFATAADVLLTGLTAWRAITEELKAMPGQRILISGGAGSFGQMAVPFAKTLSYTSRLRATHGRRHVL